jgi:hypothetical protein
MAANEWDETKRKKQGLPLVPARTARGRPWLGRWSLGTPYWSIFPLFIFPSFFCRQARRGQPPLARDEEPRGRSQESKGGKALVFALVSLISLVDFSGGFLFGPSVWKGARGSARGRPWLGRWSLGTPYWLIFPLFIWVLRAGDRGRKEGKGKKSKGLAVAVPSFSRFGQCGGAGKKIDQ